MTDQKRVRKDYPNARLVYTEYGCRIMDGDCFIAEEYFYPETDDVVLAWKYAADACKLTQNLNRTHPLRMSYDVKVSKKRSNRIKKGKYDRKVFEEEQENN